MTSLAADAPVTSPWQTVLISAGVTLAVGILSVLGAYLLERFKRSATDRRWLLDRRHEAYVQFIGSSQDLGRLCRTPGPQSAEVLDQVVVTMEELRRSHVNLKLMGSDAIQWLGHHVVEAAFGLVMVYVTQVDEKESAVRSEAHAAANAMETTLVLMMRRETQPSPWWRRRRSGIGITDPGDPMPKR